MRALRLLAVLALLPPAALACDSDERRRKDATEPANGTERDATPAVATVFLRGHVEGDRAKVDVVARGASHDVHGAAFRLRWDPGKLAFLEARASSAWSGSAVRLAKEGLPGELVVVWTEKGAATGVHAADDEVLGTVDFTVKTHDVIDLAFRPERSTLRDATGAPIRVDWHGWQVAPR